MNEATAPESIVPTAAPAPAWEPTRLHDLHRGGSCPDGGSPGSMPVDEE